MACPSPPLVTCVTNSVEDLAYVEDPGPPGVQNAPHNPDPPRKTELRSSPMPSRVTCDAAVTPGKAVLDRWAEIRAGRDVTFRFGPDPREAWPATGPAAPDLSFASA